MIDWQFLSASTCKKLASSWHCCDMWRDDSRGKLAKRQTADCCVACPVLCWQQERAPSGVPGVAALSCLPLVCPPADTQARGCIVFLCLLVGQGLSAFAYPPYFSRRPQHICHAIQPQHALNWLRLSMSQRRPAAQHPAGRAADGATKQVSAVMQLRRSRRAVAPGTFRPRSSLKDTQLQSNNWRISTSRRWRCA